MNHSAIRAADGVSPSLEPFLAPRYGWVDGRRLPATSATPGASAGYVSAHDLALFGMFHLKSHLKTQKAILSDSAIDQMKSSTVSAGTQRYGMAWWHNDLYGYRGILSQGGTDDAGAWLQLIPSEGIVVAALTNIGATLPSRVIDEILAVLLPPYRQRYAEAARGDQPRPRPRPDKSDADGPPAPLLGEWSGVIQTYRGEVPLTFSVSPSGDVHAKLGTQLATLLNQARFTSPGLNGTMMGNLGVEEDVGPDPYDLQFELYLLDDVLYGSVTTRPQSHRSARLSYWVELKHKIIGNR